TLDGARVYTQWLAPDAGGTVVPGIGGLGMTPGQLHQLAGGKAIGFEPIGHDFYERVIDMRRQLTDSRRG
ncbi:MAG: hypothetical protein AAF543_18655, partial [Pseudomonadota bacterium]